MVVVVMTVVMIGAGDGKIVGHVPACETLRPASSMS
jgi:hypothetical protein